GEAVVVRAAQQRDLVIPDQLQGAVGRRVVVDDDLVRETVARLADGAKAALDPTLAVPRHDGDREGDGLERFGFQSACLCHWMSTSMSGRVTAPHANRGRMRARFDTQRA